jgi:histidine triad (HIT) family protein
MNCIFCKIVSGEIGAKKIYESSRIISFLDISPANKGHALVVTKKHYETIFEASDEDLKELIVAVKKVSNAIMKATGASGINILCNIGEDAGQVVKHFHIHIIPRFKDDGIDFGYEPKKYSEGEMETLCNKIKKFLS